MSGLWLMTGWTIGLLVGVAIGLHLRAWMHAHRWVTVAVQYRTDLRMNDAIPGVTLVKERCADPECASRRITGINGMWSPPELGDNVKVVTDTRSLIDAGDEHADQGA